jgi:hypothetical protein
VQFKGKQNARRLKEADFKVGQLLDIEVSVKGIFVHRDSASRMVEIAGRMIERWRKNNTVDLLQFTEGTV